MQVLPSGGFLCSHMGAAAKKPPGASLKEPHILEVKVNKDVSAA